MVKDDDYAAATAAAHQSIKLQEIAPWMNQRSRRNINQHDVNTDWHMNGKQARTDLYFRYIIKSNR